ncbi:mandelate racemase/muconate lactonizing protein [Bordetella ansorpii]|uniref:glucarate dehydratase n=1 Tax=Bordetella ansorpii TaxID=288768 RepID=A0A157PIA7_9BORD|nr:mandelate racemase/muconate lactonizing enzyme family protein [Bordetella ansorpii]SAI33207.1 mandelate racemase/muconate lactonizing protein [Bordetella ansorpii]
MKIVNVETLSCDAGWRNYHFVKIETDEGLVGWSEYDEGFGSPGVSAVIEQLAQGLVNAPVPGPQRFYAEAYSRTRPAAGGVVGEGIGALENALLDLRGKILGVPCYELLGGKVRDELRVYWSHCPAWRINHPKYFGPPVTDLDGVRAMGSEARERGFTALKTNLFLFDDGPAHAWRPGFAAPFYPELNADRRLIHNLRDNLEALREGAGPDMDILLDLNFNFKTEGYLKLLRAIADQDLFWVEIDSYNPEALAYIRQHSPFPISSCETLFGTREFMPYLRNNAVDVAIVDAVWNGVWQSMKIADLADTHEVNVAPHNFYGHLCTFMNAHFACAAPNFRIMETDIDRLAWDDELFTHAPEYRDGRLIVPDRPGWGTDPVEEALRAHPPKQGGGLIQPRPKH